jgi:hypothetical protein
LLASALGGIGYAVAAGSAFLRWQAGAPRRVLLIDGELPQADLRQRLWRSVRPRLQPAPSRSIRYVPGWSGSPATIVGRAIARTHEAPLTGHDLHDRQGGAPAERQTAYRALFRAALDEAFVDSLRAATNGGWALGDARFKRQIAKALGRRVAPLPKGGHPRRKRNDSN